ncbi:MAG: YeeE/YedE family protein [Bdellovibrionaceae bacterium]|nr:YeeE/YedE family protein [Pseudobdellovibrionaceae bacterium]
MENHSFHLFRNSLVALVVGLLFALGLGIAGMTQPEKVIGFLDVADTWDPSLLFVMVGAVGFHFVTYRLIRKRSSPFFSPVWHVPTKRDLTPTLVIGSFIFGIGWGIAGYCPGPAITALASFEVQPVIFILGLLLGMVSYKILDRKYQLKK